MASLALQQARWILPNIFKTPLLRPLFLGTASPSFLGASWHIASFPSIWETLFPAILRAVPKKKVSHSRKSMRSANKGLKDKQNIVNCSACGTPKLAHNLCPNCYSFLKRLWKKMPDLR
ncbi:hypothetical protein BDZ89DRAFT_1008174 [Hymenopellis radicata]|nr:hypothetical protein BDZ89DRAFT_1008174 [Hymenopellis radicata]